LGNNLPSLIGEKLKKLRKEHNLTQEKIAEKIGCTTKTYRSWEKNRSVPGGPELIAIANLFGVDCDYLIDNIEEKTHDLLFVCNYTGLSSDCVQLLQDYSKIEPEHDLINRLLFSPQFTSRFLHALVNAYFSTQVAIQAGRIAEATTISSTTIKDNLKKDLEEKKRDLRIARFEFGEACMALLDDLFNAPDLINDIEKLIKSLDRKRIDAIMEEYNNGEH